MKYKVISLLKLRVRQQPNTESKILRYLKRGTIIEVDKYGNEWSHLKSGGYVASRLIKKVVTPNPPKPVETNQQKIGRIANELAYKTNDSKAKYPSGKPTEAYRKAFQKAFPKAERDKWKSKAQRNGANCGGFIGTVVRTSGIDKTFPHTAHSGYKRMAKSSKWQRVSKPQTGDIIVYQNKKGSWHICMAYDGKVKEASYNQFYPKTTNALAKRTSKADKRQLYIFRAR